ncbi:hypothetical protein BBD39_11170 [Arsenophonus endosymbiont of Bemisia tabaci Asia II 3]|nr:hypothetical protein BBD39_11170 [Arsenophonus endosymbiont of Bemisia tabaci Asia II 3]
MPQSFKRQQEFATAIIGIIKKARYRCDIASLNSPDTDWRKIILQVIDNGLSKKIGRTRPTQFRFLFGQSPTVFLNNLSSG